MNGLLVICALTSVLPASLDDGWSTLRQDMIAHSDQMKGSSVELTIYDCNINTESWRVRAKSWQIRKTAGTESVILGDHGIPELFLADHGIVSVAEISGWESWPHPDWHFELSSKRSRDFHLIASSQRGRRVRLDVWSLLEPIFSDESFEYTYDPVSMVSEAQPGPFGPRVYIRRHTPRDQLQARTQVAAIELSSDTRNTLEIRDFQFGQLPNAAHFPDFALLNSLSNAKPRTEVPVLTWRPMKELEIISSARALNRLDPGSSGKIAVAAKNLSNEFLDFLSKATTVNVENGTDLLFERLPSITAALDSLHIAITAHRHRLSLHIPDDPALRWRIYQRHAEAFILRSLYELIARVVVAQGDMTDSQLEAATAYIMALAECGRPPSPVPLHILETQKGPGTAAFRAILRSHWRLPCRHQDLQVCKVCTTKSESFPVLANACAEALIRTGNFDLIDDPYRMSWWKIRVQGVSGALLWKRILTISESKAGRDWLRYQFGATNDQSMRHAISSVLTERVDALQKTKRFDFMTETEAKQIEIFLNTAD